MTATVKLPDIHTTTELLNKVKNLGIDPIQEKKRFYANLLDYSKYPDFVKENYKTVQLKALCQAVDYPSFSVVWNKSSNAKTLKGLNTWLAKQYHYESELCLWIEHSWSIVMGCPYESSPTPTPTPQIGIKEIVVVLILLLVPVVFVMKNFHSEPDLVVPEPFIVIKPGPREEKGPLPSKPSGELFTKDPHLSNTNPYPSNTSPSIKEFEDISGLPMVIIPSGRIDIGSIENREPDRKSNEHYHKAINIKGFAIGKFEVTIGNWQACVNAGSCDNRTPGDSSSDKNKPMTNVSLKDAKKFTAWLSKETGKNYRLPDEYEWEYAARAGRSNSRFYWGNELVFDKANCLNCIKSLNVSGTTKVGSFEPNGFGLYDIHGNVWELTDTSECYADNLLGTINELDQLICPSAVIRGGSYVNEASAMRLSRREAIVIERLHHSIGFRVVRDDL